MKTNTMNRGFRLAVGTVTLLFAGIIYAWSILKAPLGEEFGWTAADLAFNFTLTMCFFCIGGLISGLMAKKTQPGFRLLISAIMVFLGFFISSRISGESIIPLYLSYGVLSGLGIGIVYNTVISATNAWFPDKKGICSGVLLMGFGFSTLILGKIAGTMLISPNIGWRTTYLLVGIAIGVVILVSAFLIKLPPKDAVFPEPKKIKSKNTDNNSTRAIDYTALQMILRPSFWMLFIFFILFAAVGSTAISFAKDFCISLGVTESFAVTMVGILAVFNGLGRLCSGAIFDNLGLRKTQFATSAVVILATALSLIAVLSGSMALGLIGISLCGFSYGFSPTVSTAFAAAFYGPKNFALNLSILNLILIPASFTATLAGSFVTSTGSYVSTFVMLFAFSIAGLILNIFIKKP